MSCELYNWITCLTLPWQICDTTVMDVIHVIYHNNCMHNVYLLFSEANFKIFDDLYVLKKNGTVSLRVFDSM